ncbi:hypothetical protein QUA82_14065 [Microcoleus sp. F8-D3]
MQSTVYVCAIKNVLTVTAVAVSSNGICQMPASMPAALKFLILALL